jgi:hypothetical protein
VLLPKPPDVAVAVAARRAPLNAPLKFAGPAGRSKMLATAAPIHQGT